MMRSPIVRRGALPGAIAGLFGGLAFGAAMGWLGYLPTVASIVRASAPQIGFLVHMVIAAVVGAGFGVLVRDQRLGVGEMLFWGMTYGSLWWFLGPLSLLPLILGGSVAWNVPAAQAAFPSLVGHLWYGAVTAVAYAVLRRRERPVVRVTGGTLALGGIAGLAGAWLFQRLVNGQAPWLIASGIVTRDAHGLNGIVTALAGLVAGAGFAVLYPRPRDGSGPVLIQGTMYGFACWVAGALTLAPIAAGMGLAWSVDAARARFPLLPGCLLAGAFLALVYRWVDGLARFLFADDVGERDEEGIGTRGLRALGRGAFAGLIGGLIFTIIMLRIGFLPTVARLVGAFSLRSGLIVHLVIANLIGASFGLLFLRRSFDLGSALGWGISYGFFWWVLGPLTLLPVLLGAAPRWTPEIAAALMPSLIGHLAYGAAVGVTFYLLEARYNPWWISDTDAEALRTANRREQVLTSAPALWALVVVIALTLPVLLTCVMSRATPGPPTGAPASSGGYGVASPALAYGKSQTPADACGQDEPSPRPSY
jgi:hypothetical protein